MKKLFLLSLFALILPTTLLAQDDDMYFVPTKKNVEKAKKEYGMPRDTYYSGSNRSVDDYNRRYVSTVQAVDSLGNIIGGTDGSTHIMVGDSIGNDIIDMDGVTGVYPDSSDDYAYTRRMSRWDDYDWQDGYRTGYFDGRFGRWGWSSYYPYYSGWYGGWYDPWFSPWYYSGWGGYWGYAGWYDSWWRYPYYGWGHWHGGWYPSHGIAWTGRTTGTRNHSATSSRGNYNYRRYNSLSSNRGGSVNTNGNRTMNFGGARNPNTNNQTYQNNTSSQPRSNSSFGGTRSSGGSFGGGNRGGGGSGRFGGGRR